MAKCRICQSTYQQLMTFGKMPLANGFLRPEQFSDEYFFELAVGFCERCTMFQLIDQPEPEKMFHDHYAFFSGTSTAMTQHFERFARLVIDTYLSSDTPFVVEIGSNDGIMLQHFKQAGIKHLGIEPSENVAEVARSKGIQTISKFFSESLAKEIVAEHGQADAYLAANVMCHIPTLHSVAAGIKLLLKPKGVALFEDPYLGDVIEKTSYDQIYDEHVFLFSLSSISALFAQHDMEVIDVQPQTTHGGSMRYVIGHKEQRTISPAVAELRDKEHRLGLADAATYEMFRENCERSKEKLFTALESLRQAGKRVVGYGATSKSTTVINYCGITPEQLEFISDTTPIKQGTFSPGAHIPVRAYQEFIANYPDVALLFAWNHAQEIFAKERKFSEGHHQWLTFVPEVTLSPA